MRILPDMMLPGLDLIVFAIRRPLLTLAIVAGVAAITVLLIVLIKRSKKKNRTEEQQEGSEKP